MMVVTRADTLFPPGGISFQTYLEIYQIDPLKLSIVSRVRYLTIWKIQNGFPVTQEQAEQVRKGLAQIIQRNHIQESIEIKVIQEEV